MLVSLGPKRPRTARRKSQGRGGVLRVPPVPAFRLRGALVPLAQSPLRKGSRRALRGSLRASRGPAPASEPRGPHLGGPQPQAAPHGAPTPPTELSQTVVLAPDTGPSRQLPEVVARPLAYGAYAESLPLSRGGGCLSCSMHGGCTNRH